MARRKVDKKAFGRRVARRRAALGGLSQGELATAVGMKQQGIGSIEKGDVARPRFLRELATALRTTQEWLLWEEGEEELPEVEYDALLLLQKMRPGQRKLALRMLRAMLDEQVA